MWLRLRGVQQVKVPVSDLQASVDWYCRFLELRVVREFVEAGVLAGATLFSDRSGLMLSLRRRDRVPGSPSFAGFDLFSVGVEGLEDLEAIIARAETLGATCSEVVDRGPDGHHLDVTDPDGTHIRFLTPFAPGWATFGGVEFDGDGFPSFYSEPRLR